jgi:dihydrolipoamide dehydrogenase
MESFDVAVVGSGPGGYVAAIRCAQLGLKTACIEKDATLGGTCLNVGCIPSKALLHSTEYYEWILKKSKENGIEVPSIQANLSQMMQRKDQVVKSHVDGIQSLFKKNKVTKVQGKARLLPNQQLEVSNGSEKQILAAKNIILATGSASIPLPALPFDEATVISSTGALALKAIPPILAVVGAGVIGVELASVYRRLGSQVIIVEMLDRVCPGMDFAISKMLLQILKKQGLDIHLGSKVTKVQKKNQGIAFSYIEEEKETTIEADAVLVAIGRKPYSDGLGLKEVGIEMTSKGFVQINRSFQTSLPYIYAIGDLIEGPMLAHRASEEGMAVAELIAGQQPHVNYITIPNVVYTHPEVAALGLTEEESKAAGLETKIGTCLFRANSRARCIGETEGMVKVIGESKTDRLIGMHILGAHASEMIGIGVMALEKKMTIAELANACYAHPTLSEAIKEAALNALGRAIHF